MKTKKQVTTKRELLAKLDELRSLQETRERVLSFMDNLGPLVGHIQAEEPKLAKLLWTVHKPLYRKVDEVTGRMDDLVDQIDRLYADLLVQEPDAGASIPSAMDIIFPPYVAQEPWLRASGREEEIYDWRRTATYDWRETTRYATPFDEYPLPTA